MSAAVILVAHGELIQRKLIDMLLSAAEPEFVMCEDGRQALEYLRDHTPDLVIVDAELPLVDGFDICSKVKSIKRLAAVPVVLTIPKRPDRDTRELRELASEAGADLVLQQPFGDKNLHDRVLALLQPKPGSIRTPPTHTTQVIETMLASPQLRQAGQQSALEERVRELEAENQVLRDKLREMRRRLEAQEDEGPRGLFGFFKK